MSNGSACGEVRAIDIGVSPEGSLVLVTLASGEVYQITGATVRAGDAEADDAGLLRWLADHLKLRPRVRLAFDGPAVAWAEFYCEAKP